jgi:hypothetical protein
VHGDLPELRRAKADSARFCSSCGARLLGAVETAEEARALFERKGNTVMAERTGVLIAELGA